jgi:thiol:disulfide interchange protein DsbD
MNKTSMTLITCCRTAFVAVFVLLAGSARADLAAPVSAESKAPTGIAAALRAAQQKSGEPDFLPPDQAFRFAALPDGPDSIRLIWGITDGYYLYRARIKASSDTSQAKLGELILPAGETKMDEYFGKQEVYHHDIVGSISVARSSSGGLSVPLKVTYQGCASAGLCYPPITKMVNVVLPTPGTASAGTGIGGGSAAAATGTASSATALTGNAAQSAGDSSDLAASRDATSSKAAGNGSLATSNADTSTTPATSATGAFVSEQDKLAALIRDGNLAAVLGTFFGIGLLLSLTPCVLPMIPILSGIIVGQGDKVTPARGFSLAFIYTQGMAVTYAVAGAVFVLVFKQAPQAFFQQPWIIMLFVALFVALAFAMFGAYTLQMPSALQTRLTSVSNQQKSGSYVGCFVMGALSALVVTACVAPALIAALSVISQTGKIARGAAALYVTGLGMGVPLLLVGASAGSLLPKVGPWMDTVKSLFGVLFLALAIYFLQPLISASVGMLLWSALAVIAGFWIFALEARDGGPAPAAIRAAGLLALVYGIILLIGVAAGSNDPLQPLSTLRASNAGGGPVTATKESALAFDTIKSLDDLNKRVAAATAAGRPVMLDFYADWCTSCKEMERYTFSDKSVQAALSNAVLLHADVTKNDPVDQELLKHFGIFGPPTIAFYGPDGEERPNFRVVGYMKAAEFASLASRAFRPNLSASSATVPGAT